MANRVYIIPRRNDLAGSHLYLKLKPIAGQKNSINDGEHQDCYLHYSFDVPGTTTTVGGAYSSGSLNTTPNPALVVTSTQVMADVSVTPFAASAPTFGLEAYLRERVTNAGNVVMPAAVAARARQEILKRVYDGLALDATGINAAMNTAATAIGGYAATCSLTGGNSIGTVEDVIRILSGEAYITPCRTIVANQAGVFLGSVARTNLAANATAAVFYARGHFLAADESGYRAMPVLVDTGDLRASVMLPGGQLRSLVADAQEILNTNSFAYTAGTVDAWHPRAQAIHSNGTLVDVPSTGSALVLRVYRNDGTCLVPVI